MSRSRKIGKPAPATRGGVVGEDRADRSAGLLLPLRRGARRPRPPPFLRAGPAPRDRPPAVGRRVVGLDDVEVRVDAGGSARDGVDDSAQRSGAQMFTREVRRSPTSRSSKSNAKAWLASRPGASTPPTTYSFPRATAALAAARGAGIGGSGFQRPWRRTNAVDSAASRGRTLRRRRAPSWPAAIAWSTGVGRFWQAAPAVADRRVRVRAGRVPAAGQEAADDGDLSSEQRRRHLGPCDGNGGGRTPARRGRARQATSKQGSQDRNRERVPHTATLAGAGRPGRGCHAAPGLPDPDVGPRLLGSDAAAVELAFCWGT